MLVIIKNVSLDFCVCDLPHNLSISRKRGPKIPGVHRSQFSLTLARRYHYHAEAIPQLTFFFLSTTINFLLLQEGTTKPEVAGKTPGYHSCHPWPQKVSHLLEKSQRFWCGKA